MSAASRSAVRSLQPRARRFVAGTAVAGFFAATAALVALVPGCGGGSSDYYCDATGCYECDGFGCASVDPPLPTTCSKAGDAVCPSGEVCTDQGCMLPCKADASCARGLVCKQGFCAAPTAKDPTKLVCGVSADCGASGFDCVDGACVAIPACSGVGCVCKYSSECGDGRVCANGQCVESCSATAPCATGFTCDANGLCQRSATPVCGAAAGGATCASGQRCVDGQCAAGCAADAECLGADGKPDAQQRCVGGACVPNPRPPTCNGAAQCGTNQQCIEGFCRYSCAVNDDCLAIDTRIGTCAKDKVCRSATEANAECTAQADCASGKSCVDGKCK